MDVRGEIVHLDHVLDEVSAIHDYPPAWPPSSASF
jgi:redox-regulated HSP33 family molecular chaperone